MGLWYVSVTILAFFFIFTLVRYVIFLTTWIMGWELWLLPNIFADDLGFCDSFRPGYSFDKGENGQLNYRIATLVRSNPIPFDPIRSDPHDMPRPSAAGTRCHLIA